MENYLVDNIDYHSIRWSKSLTHDELLKIKENKYLKIHLTPNKFIPKNWFGSGIDCDINGKNILGIACGGAEQMPILSVLGAKCTLIDYSFNRIQIEKDFSNDEGYKIKIIRTDLSDNFPFDNESFDIIIFPSKATCLEKLLPFFKECFRVLKKDGVFLGGYDNGLKFISNDGININRELPHNPLKNVNQMCELKDHDQIEFSHTIEDIIGNQLLAGFTISSIFEDTDLSGKFKDLNIPTFVAIKSIKK